MEFNYESSIIWLIPFISFIVCCIFADVRIVIKKLESIEDSIINLKNKIKDLEEEIDSANSKLNITKAKNS